MVRMKPGRAATAGRHGTPALFLAAVLSVAVSCIHAASPRIAVWDPVVTTETARFSVDAGYARRVGGWLEEAGIEVRLLTAEQIAAPALFSAARFDALFMQGGAIPRRVIAACLAFLRAGGVLVALASPNCFEIGIEQGADGRWRLSPEEPRFAWQVPDIHEALGFEFRPSTEMINAGVHHTPAGLLTRYLPGACDVTRPLAARWLVPRTAAFHALIRSRMAGGQDYTPQVMVCVNGDCRAILCSSGFWTAGPDHDQIVGIGGQFRSIAFRPGAEGSEAAEWPFAREMVVAFARLAADLRAGALVLSPRDVVRPVDSVVVPPPFAFRGIRVGVDPEGVRPLFRCGGFDGSNAEHGSDGTPAAGVIRPGVAHAFRLPVSAGKPAQIRFRGAVADGRQAGLAITVKADGQAETMLWNERLVRRDVGPRYAGATLEFTRIVLMPAQPAGTGRTLFVANPGPGPLLLDAFQVEPLQRGDAAPAFEFGAHTSTSLAYDGKSHGLTAEICKDWTHIRCTTRVWWVGEPGQEGRWARFDNHVERYLALHRAPQFILEGTPRWAAISDQRWQEGGRRPHMAAPDNRKYAELAERILSRYADRVADWEIGNETTVHGFWNGTPGEFTEFHKTLAPLVRKLDPSARVITAGMAGVTRNTIDPFILAMSRSGALRPETADLFGVHCYCHEGMWDMPYGLAEGHLFALGEAIEIYPNEQGTEIKGRVTVNEQAIQNSRGMARLLASGATKITIFQSDSPLGSSPFGMLDERGNPRPAYEPFRDYLALAWRHGRRTPLAMTSPDGPLAGVYAAAATHDDGTLTVVLNPADADSFLPPPDPAVNLLSRETRGRWVNFFGAVTWQDTAATNRLAAVPADNKRPVGFYCRTVIDTRRQPRLILSVAEAEGPWQLMLKHGPEKTTVPLVQADKPGLFEIDLRDKLPGGPADVEISFRARARITLNKLLLPLDPAFVPEAPSPLRLRLAVPVPAGATEGTWAVRDSAGRLLPARLGQGTIFFDHDLTRRAVLHIVRQD